MNVLVIGLGRINVQNKDGGAIRLYQTLRELQKKKVAATLLIPKIDYRNFRDYHVHGTYSLLSDWLLWTGNAVLIYGSRIIHGILYAIRDRSSQDIVYAASDFWHDIIPALCYKLFHPRVKLLACLFLIAPPPLKNYENMFSEKLSFPSLWGLLFFMTQQAAIFLLRHNADAVLVLNQFDKKQLEERGIDREKIHVVSMGIAVGKGIQKQKPVYDAAFIGRLHAQKGITDLIRIWKRVTARRKDARLIVVGGGSDHDIQNLKNDIRRNGLEDNIRYYGYADGTEKESLLTKSKMLLVPSHYESWGQVVAEGMAAGVPVVSYRLPVYESLFGRYIRMVQFGDINAFAEEVLSVLKSGKEADKRSTQARAFVRKYEWQQVARGDYSIMRAVAGNNNEDLSNATRKANGTRNCQGKDIFRQSQSQVR